MPVENLTDAARREYERREALVPSFRPIQIDPEDGHVVWETFDGVFIVGDASMVKPGPGEVGYWGQDGNSPDMAWSPGERRLRIGFNKRSQRIRYEGETEDYVEIIIEDKPTTPDAPDTGKLPCKASDYR